MKLSKLSKKDKKKARRNLIYAILKQEEWLENQKKEVLVALVKGQSSDGYDLRQSIQALNTGANLLKVMKKYFDELDNGLSDDEPKDEYSFDPYYDQW